MPFADDVAVGPTRNDRRGRKFCELAVDHGGRGLSDHLKRGIGTGSEPSVALVRCKRVNHG